jgi:hypothetical protein
MPPVEAGNLINKEGNQNDNKQQKSYCPPPPRELPLTKTLFLLITTFILTLTLASCGDKGEGGTDTSGGATIVTNSDGSCTISGVQVKDGSQISWEKDITAASLPNFTGTLDYYYYYWDEPITDNVPGSSVKITNGKLNMTLGTPKDEYLKIDDWYDEMLIERTITPSNAKLLYDFFSDEAICITANMAYSLACFKRYTETGFEYAGLIYADRDVTIKGTYTYRGKQEYNCSLKKGWNYLIKTSSNGDDSITTASQSLPSGFYWVVLDEF